MRIGEIIGLKWSDIDFLNQTIYVNRTLVYIKSDDKDSPNFDKWGFEFHEPKTDKGRRKISMTLKAYQILKKQLLWKRSIEAQFKPLSPHTLRHTFVTRCIERGMNPKTLQIILGHSTIQLTMNLYCHVTDDMLISEMSKFENGARTETCTSHAKACSVTGVAL